MLVLVGGLPKGGTQYAADVLTECGLPCRRETAFKQPNTTLYPTDCLAESSYLAIPWFERFAGIKILVARPPFNVIRSQYGALGLLHSPDQYFCHLFPELLEVEGLKRFALLWVKWMEWGLKHADIVWSLPISTQDVIKVSQQFNQFNFPTPKLFPTRINNVPIDTNTLQQSWRKVDIPWGEVTLDLNLMDQIQSTAEKLSLPLFME